MADDSRLINLFMKMIKNQEAIITHLKNISGDNNEAHSKIDEKLFEVLSTSISMMKITEDGVTELNKAVSGMMGVENLTRIEYDEFFSPIQKIVFERIFEVISLEKDISTDSIKNGFLVYASQTVGFLNQTEKMSDRKDKEAIFIKCFDYLRNSFDLSVRSSMLIIGYFDLYLIFTTIDHNTRMNGLFQRVRQILFANPTSITKINDIIPFPEFDGE